MADNATKPKSGRPRGRTAKPNALPIASGQLTPDENTALDNIASVTGQSRSQLVRRAVVLLINAAWRDNIDFGKAPALMQGDEP